MMTDGLDEFRDEVYLAVVSKFLGLPRTTKSGRESVYFAAKPYSTPWVVKPFYSVLSDPDDNIGRTIDEHRERVRYLAWLQTHRKPETTDMDRGDVESVPASAYDVVMNMIGAVDGRSRSRHQKTREKVA